MNTIPATALAAALAVGTAPAWAHHSFAAYYFEEQSVTIEGTVAEFDYSAPHAWLHVTVVGPGGEPQRFAAEWSNPNRLSRDRVQRDTVKPGDRVIVTGSPGRNPAERKIHLKRIERPADGWRWGR